MNKWALPSGVWLLLLGLFLFPNPALWAADQAPAAKPLKVLDIGERTFQDGPALAVVLSQPLDPKARHDDFLRIADPKEVLKSAWVLSDDHRVLYFPHVEPQTQYTVTVMEGLTSAAGQAVDQRYSKSVTTRAITPGVNFASDGLLLPQKMTEGLPVATVNVPTVEMEFFRLNESGIRSFINWENLTARQDYEVIQSVARNGNGQFVYSGRFDLDPVRNKRVIRHVPVMKIEALQQPGVYFAVMRRPGEYDASYQTTFFLVTDIGLHARVYQKEVLVIASSLKTGLPLAGARLTFFDKKAKPSAEGQTDQDGRFVLAGNQALKNISFVQATHEGHVTVLPFEVPALDLSEFDLGGRTHQPREVFIYGPRDLYRPGETVVLSALLRDYDGRVAKALPLNAILFRPDGRKARTFTWHPDAGAGGTLGYYQTEVALPADAQTGRWRLELRDNPAAGPIQTYSFGVEDFMPERMKLQLTSGRKVLPLDAPWTVEVDGQYLYGAPAAGNRLDAKVRVKANRTPLEAYPEFLCGQVDDQDYSDYWDLAEASMDDAGRTKLAVEPKWSDVASPLSVRLTASLFETGGRPVTRSIEGTAWPAEALIGVRPLFTIEQVDEGRVNFEIIKVRVDGTLTPVSGLLLTLIKEERDYYWEFSEARGWQYKYTDKTYTYQDDVVTFDGKKPANYGLELPHGRYVLEIKDPETDQVTSVRFNVGRWWYGRGDRSAARPDRVELDLDKERYQPGDIIHLKITPPQAGQACVMVEGQTLLWFKRLNIPAGGTTIEIPVAAAWDSHDLYVGAVVFRPGEAKEKITPNRAVGLVHLPLDREPRRLATKIEAPERVTPIGPTKMTTSIKLDGKPKGPVFVTLAAVDVGILSITDFQTPDAWAWFFSPRRYNTDQYDIYGRVVEILDGQPAILKCGGDADQGKGGQAPGTKVKLVSLFQAPVAFDDQGQAQVSLTVPGDFSGRLRLMALAFGGESFGSAQTEVTVAAPIVTQLAMPRFLAPDDESELTLDVHNMSQRDQELKISMTATHPLILDGGFKTLSLKDKQKVTLRFPIKARPDFAASTIKLHVEGQDLALDSDWQLGVRPGYPALARKVRRILKKGELWLMDRTLAADLLPASVEADLKVSPVIPLNIRQAMRDLIAYPYGCLEQTTSRAYPLLQATPENVARYGLTELDPKVRLERLDGAIERISLMQIAKGGFGLWNERSQEETWLTVYATDFLLQARDLGVNVPPNLLNQALSRLDFYLQRKAPTDNGGKSTMDALDFAVRAYAGYVLARVERAPLAALRLLYDNHRQQAVSSLPLTHLGLALRLMGDQIRSDAALVLAGKTRRSERYFWGDYGSPIRDLALSVALLTEHKVQTASIEKLLLDLEDQLRQRQWLSTQEKYALFKLGVAMEGRSEDEWNGQVTLAGRSTVLKQKKAFLAELSPAQMARGVTVRSDHDRPLYVSAVVGGYTRTPPTADNSRIVLDREMFDLEGKKVTGTEFKVGDLFLVHLSVNSKEQLPDALIVDQLPAGFEIENPNFKYTLKLDDSKLENLKVAGQQAWRLKENTDLIHEEYRDDRYVAVMELHPETEYHLFYLVRAVSPGRFTVPPALAESMYRPEFRGIGLTGKPITILNKRK